MEKIGYVILNYNNWEDTFKCIDSLVPHLTDNEKIYLVDNASTEFPGNELVRIKKINCIQYIQSEHNGGYSSGNNKGLSVAISDGCEYIIICNNDLLFKGPISHELIKYCKDNPKTGVVGPSIVDSKGMHQEVNTGLKLTLLRKYMYMLRRTPLAFLVESFVRQNNALNYKYDNPILLHAVSGCCFMIEKGAYHSILPLDERFFLYMEEQVIGWRLQANGLSCALVPTCEVEHSHGKSTANLRAFSFACLIESEILYFRKYCNNNRLAIIPLLLIRVSQYIIKSIFHEDYRTNANILIPKLYNALK